MLKSHKIEPFLIPSTTISAGVWNLLVHPFRDISGHNTTRGHICYHCDHPVDDPKQCDKIRICSHDQVGYIYFQLVMLVVFG